MAAERYPPHSPELTDYEIRVRHRQMVEGALKLVALALVSAGVRWGRLDS